MLVAKFKKYGEHVKVWKANNGIIPKDEMGRSYEIHHIDGNPKNNSIDNLMCLSISDHYEIHKKQEDWVGAFMIARRMDQKPHEISDIARHGTLERIAAGTHNFQDPNFPRSFDHNKGFVVALDLRTESLVRVSKKDFDLYSHYVGSNFKRKHKNVHMNRGHNKGKTWLQKNKETPKKCIYCNFEGRASHISRYHNERCKYKNES